MSEAKLFTEALERILTFTMLWASTADDKLMKFFLFFLENKIRHFKQIGYLGDNVYEMSDPIFYGKNEP